MYGFGNEGASAMSNIEAAMENAKLRFEISETRHMMHQLRKYLGGALCTVCGEPLGMEDELTQNDDEETMHLSCESKS